MSTHAPLVVAQKIPVGEHVQAEFAGMTFNLDTIWATLIAGAVVLGLGFWFKAKVTSGVPSKIQLVWEVLVDWVNGQVRQQLGRLNPVAVPLAVSLFIFILVCNWFELIPTGHHPKLLPAPTADVNLVYALALVALIGAHVFGVQSRGLHYFAHYKNPMEIITELSKFLSLPLRLFGNIFAGGLMLSIIALLPLWVFWLPDVLWRLFDMFIGGLQAFIFALLTIVYWGQLGGHTEETAGGKAH